MEKMALFVFAAGLAAFLYGMKLMGAGLAGLAGGRLERFLAGLTEGSLKAVLVGAGVTAVVQSSSVTTVMVVGLVDSGMMKLEQAAGVIMGANVGTTVTAWILAATERELHIPPFVVPAVIGFVFLMFSGHGRGSFAERKLIEEDTVADGRAFACRKSVADGCTSVCRKGVADGCTSVCRKNEIEGDASVYGEMVSEGDVSACGNIAAVFMGFALLLLGMDAMSGAVRPFSEMTGFQWLLTGTVGPLIGVAAGLAFTALLQSSSCSVGILQALCGVGEVSYRTAIPIIMGQNIGTCATALLACVGAGKNARRAALLHLYFNVLGTAIGLAVFYGIDMLRADFMAKAADAFGIALIHTIFNVVTTVALLPFSDALVTLSCAMLSDAPYGDTKKGTV